ncbi:uncharacterized protein LOC131335072 isoform X2 [Rhododendron vialii]|uniref:uncharacterized protein LOC131335072 isoform X2 n=1 Tax=Rhododendron vialii TaxID=182163 RepID=UPI00265F98D5|nr:uncharacterized protein LOC131335072 isoform X2 [Rhododendron vialii]
MACAPLSAPAPAIEFKRLGARTKIPSAKKPRHKHPLTATVAGGSPLKLRAKLPLQLNLPLRRKLSTRGRDWFSCTSTSSCEYPSINSSGIIINWGMCNFKWFRRWYIIIPWSWTSRMVSIYLVLCLSFAAEARDIPHYPFDYHACENVRSYYAGMEDLRGEALQKKLNSIIARHHPLSYKEVWEALKILDAADADKPEASLEVVEIYSLRVVSKLLAGKPEGWNREHLWPRSYGLMSGPSLTDLHNIRPADVNVNSSRGNKFYGECHVSSSNCRKPATRESAFDTEADKERWAPPRQVRGDIARAIMYMAVCYGVNQSGRGLNLHLSDSPNIANKEMGMLSTLLKWNEIDPPSREEKLRNERICIKYQHNRNPFVDHPEYANRIWKHVVPRH